MTMKKGQIITGNDGKKRKILYIYKGVDGREICAYNDLKEGKYYGPVRKFYTSNKPKWLV